MEKVGAVGQLRPRWAGLAATLVLVCGLVEWAAASPALADPSCSGTAPVNCVFFYTGAAQYFTVPANVTQVTIDAVGAPGGPSADGFGLGGLGGQADAAIAVTPGETLQINVGGAGGPGQSDGTQASGGWNGGGPSGTGIVSSGAGGGAGGGGGGASDVRQGGTGLADRVVIAGGGGGAGSGCGGTAGPQGGAGGGTSGASYPCGGLEGSGGTQTAGGTTGVNGTPGTAGTLGTGGSGGSGVANTASSGVSYGGGGGGGGLYGGGGGSGNPDCSVPGIICETASGPGGGGSGLVPPGGSMGTGVQSGSSAGGEVTITYFVSGVSNCPGPIAVITTSLPPAQAGVFYQASLTACGGTPPYAWSLQPGASLPAGLSLDPTGVIAGTPTTAGQTFFGVLVADSSSPQLDAAANLSITVSPPVAPSATATSLSSSPNPSVAGQAVAYTATVSPAPDGGTVAFTDGTTTITGCGAQPVDTTTGEATCQVTYTSAGSHTITAAYSGDTSFAASTSAVLTQGVMARATSTTVTCSPGTVLVGQPVTCTATVTDTAVGTASTPDGSVTFASDTSGGSFSNSGSCALTPTGTAGQASCSVSYTPGQGGTQTVTASYGGDPAHAASSGSAAVIVTKRATSTAVSCKLQAFPGFRGKQLVCTAVVTDTASGTTSPPTGTVSFAATDPTVGFSPNPCTLSGAGGSAAICSTRVVYSGLLKKSITVTATYSGDSVHAPSSGSASL